MRNLNKRTKNKPKPKPTLIFKNCSFAYHCAQLSYARQHRNSYDNFSSYPADGQTIIIVQRGRGYHAVLRYHHTFNPQVKWETRSFAPQPQRITAYCR